MTDHEHRIRLVLLGGAGVGKSSIINRFLFSKYTDKYKSTVEDLYNRDYEIGRITLKVDILDTAGDFQFPAMRRLSIANAHAFLIVYSIDQTHSFDTVRQVIRDQEQRTDFEEIPIVIAGNKMDLEIERQVFKEDVTDWIYRELQRFRCRVIECSAKENLHIKDIFRTFLQIGKVPQGEDSSLKRQSSAYCKTRSQHRSQTPPSDRESIPENGGASGSTPPSAFSRNKPRSRSLIRRSSKKAKQQVRDAQPDECSLS
ncbi:ras-related protein Rap-1b-like [Eriocheir sinensis]|uniref:ras-related protein Rap-1b-like n=1 Tax=Eriocheir sinensis TaxID=95602 RepID=UPI0021C60040|nr:ras-related protein Rap-1b-like [Eriocheir sinensis]XP_050691170.1 ras-related protein Rap-1b-like [Eriocheir sinensis]XP_050691171.1 ras-related protein Rap-1b-like [Eriocheir sinensis]XP_050691172.1 ras-related protein Rap-1b-like [Eriocheir sinensis]